jgi:hypothetical protein
VLVYDGLVQWEFYGFGPVIWMMGMRSGVVLPRYKRLRMTRIRILCDHFVVTVWRWRGGAQNHAGRWAGSPMLWFAPWLATFNPHEYCT